MKISNRPMVSAAHFGMGRAKPPVNQHLTLEEASAFREELFARLKRTNDIDTWDAYGMVINGPKSYKYLNPSINNEGYCFLVGVLSPKHRRALQRELLTMEGATRIGNFASNHKGVRLPYLNKAIDVFIEIHQMARAH